MSHSDLIDTTEMYLRTVYELEEEGIVPLRARIAERLHQSGPTVSQTVARMERDGLLTVQGDRHLELSPKGRALATRVMRKHRLAERLLVDVIGLDWELVHVEACRWEHVISDDVERRLVSILGEPTVSPYGNPIPGLSELGYTGAVEDFLAEVESLEQVVAKAGPGEETKVVVRRISEPLQTTPELMEVLRRAGALPGQTVTVTLGPDSVLVRGGDGDEGGEVGADGVARIAGATAEIARQHAGHIFVRRL